MSALVSKRYQNDTSIIDGRNIFGPEISLVNVDQIWEASKWHHADQLTLCTHRCVGASAMVSSLTEASSLKYRAQSLVNAGAAVNIEGAEMILNTTIELIVRDGRESSAARRSKSMLMSCSACCRSCRGKLPNISQCPLLAAHALVQRPYPYRFIGPFPVCRHHSSLLD